MSIKASSGPTQCAAVKAIIKNDESKILVLKQSAEAEVYGANKYHPPGGIVEPGEQLEDALLREVLEETGLKIEISQLLSAEEWRRDIRGEDCQFFGLFFACKLVNNSQIRLQEEEAQGFKWISKNDLENIIILEPSLGVIKKSLQ